MARLDENDGLDVAVAKLARGNPEGAAVLQNLAHFVLGPAAGPGGPMLYLRLLDKLQIYGIQLHMFFQNVCEGSYLLMLAVLHAYDRELVEAKAIHDDVVRDGIKIDPWALLAQVKDELPDTLTSSVIEIPPEAEQIDELIYDITSCLAVSGVVMLTALKASRVKSPGRHRAAHAWDIGMTTVARACALVVDARRQLNQMRGSDFDDGAQILTGMYAEFCFIVDQAIAAAEIVTSEDQTDATSAQVQLLIDMVRAVRAARRRLP